MLHEEVREFDGKTLNLEYDRLPLTAAARRVLEGSGRAEPQPLPTQPAMPIRVRLPDGTEISVHAGDFDTIRDLITHLRTRV
jgi:hypothetical protein